MKIIKNLAVGLFILIGLLSLSVSASTFTYDPDGRLITFTNDSNQTAIHTYDSVGNITAITHTGNFNPQINSFSPGYGEVGQNVSILGSNFIASTSANTVSFNGTTAAVLTASTTQLLVQVPVGATTGTISVSNTNGSTTSQNSFTVTDYGLPPVITSVNSYDIDFGGTITISGQNLNPVAGQTMVFFNNTICFINSITDSSITISIPYTVGAGIFVVSTAFGSATSSFEIVSLPVAVPSASVDSNTDMTVGASSPTTLSIASGKDYDTFTFSGNIGDFVSLQFNSVSQNLGVSIYDDDNNIIYTGTITSYNLSINLPQLPRTSTYFGVVAGTNTSYTLQVSEDQPLTTTLSSYSIGVNQTIREPLTLPANTRETVYFTYPTSTTANIQIPIDAGETSTSYGPTCQSDGSGNEDCYIDLPPSTIDQKYTILTTNTGSVATFTVQGILDSIIPLSSSTGSGSLSLVAGQSAWFDVTPTTGAYAYTINFSSMSYTPSGVSASYLYPYDQNYIAKNVGAYYYQINNATYYYSNTGPTASVYSYLGTNQPFNSVGGTPSHFQLSPASGAALSGNYNYVVQAIPILNNNGTSLSATVMGQPLYFIWNTLGGSGKVELTGLSSSADSSNTYDTAYLQIYDNTGTLVTQTTCSNANTVYYGEPESQNSCTIDVPSTPSGGQYFIILQPENITEWSFTANAGDSDTVTLTSTNTQYSNSYATQDIALNLSLTAGTPGAVLISSATVSSGDTLKVTVTDPTGTDLTSSILPYNTFGNGDGLVVNIDNPTVGGVYTISVSSENNQLFSVYGQALTPAFYNITVNASSSTPVTNSQPGQDIVLEYSGTSGQTITLNMDTLVYGNSQSSPCQIDDVYYGFNGIYTLGYCTSTSNTFSGNVGTLAYNGNNYVVIQTSAYGYPLLSQNSGLTTGNVAITAH